MSPLTALGKILLIIGIVLAVFGLLLMLGGKIPFLGKLPGDILIKRDNFTFYFPLGTSLLISIIVSLILWLFRK